MKKAVLTLLVLLAALWGLWTLSKAREVQLFGDLVARGPADAPLVALTFDDGPTEAFTPEILAILAEKDVTATFFVTGREAEEAPEALRALVAAGHEIGNHSYSHRRMVLMPPAAVRSELDRTDAAIRAAGYAGDIHFRPPYGKKLVVLPWVLSRQGRLTVMWDVETDSQLADPTVAQLVEATVAEAGPGSIILLHAMYYTREVTRAALGPIIDGLRAKGLEPVGVSALLGSR